MEKLWEFRVGKVNVAFNNNNVFLSHKNKLFCFNSEGILWNWKFHATFYRDPYEDVSITALDANQSHVLVGTNFMDGKIYLLSPDGKLLWMHQFATIASLGWRPEDVTFAKLDGQFVIVGTEFMNEYIHIYTTNRKRVFQKRVKGRVEDASLIKNKLFVGTETCMHLFDVLNGAKYSIETPAKKIVVFDDRVLVLNSDGIVVYKSKGNLRLREYWSVKSYDPVFCTAGNDTILASENLLNYILFDGEVIWQKTLDDKILSLFYDKRSFIIYVGVKDNIYVYSTDGRRVENFKLKGEPIKIDRLGSSVVAVAQNGDTVSLLKVK